jgi:hypothetical protein
VSTRTAALILAATGCAMATTGLLLLLIRPEIALVAAAAVYLASDGILRRLRNTSLIAASVLVALAAQQYIQHRKEDQW